MSQCPLTKGDTLGSYKISNKKGGGEFSGVWSTTCGTAIKVYTSDTEDSKYYQNEVKILGLLAGGPNIIEYKDTFAYIRMVDGIPYIHPCIVVRQYGGSLKHLMDISKWVAGFPIDVAKTIMLQVLIGLEYMHSRNIMHTDIKLENILIEAEPHRFNPRSFKICIADMGSSCPDDQIFTYSVGTVEYLSPELIIGAEYGKPNDIWAALILFHELITGDLLFDIYQDGTAIYGDGIDNLSIEEPNSVNDTSSIVDLSESSKSISISSEYHRSYRHLMLMHKILGPVPKKFWKEMNCESLRTDYRYNISVISYKKFLEVNYRFKSGMRSDIAKFVTQGIKYRPLERVTASQLLKNKWLLSVNHSQKK